MNMKDELNSSDLADRLNRLVKLALDTGEANSIEEAERIFATYRLAVAVGADTATSPTKQAALLTIVNASRRSLLGGVEVQGVADMPLLLPLMPYQTVAEAVVGLGGSLVAGLSDNIPLVVVGDANVDPDRPFVIQITFDGWTAGIAPLHTGFRLAEQQEFTPSGVLAGSLAVAEAFQHLRGTQPAAGRRQTGLSLWRPELDWREKDAVGPVISRLPSAMWLIGLGNLGQAYLWTIGLLPYANPRDVQLVLQDFDVLAVSNDSTSLLTDKTLVGNKKARTMAQWADQRGFQTAIVERPFSSDFRVGPAEPSVALCGVDNGLARMSLEDVGFKRVIEAGLGKGTRDFLGFRTHVFPGPKKAREIWKGEQPDSDVRTDLPAYRALADAGLDRCGLTQLAGRTVGAPFVGGIAGTLVVAELLRLVNGAHNYTLIDGHLRNLDHRSAIQVERTQPFNPGSTSVVLAP